MPAPLTPHSPVGAWTSFSFGTPGRGLAIQIDAPAPAEPNADLLVALQRDGVTTALPFVQDPAAYPGWQFVAESALSRTLTPCVDEFAAAGITLRVFTPNAALPNPKRSGNLQFATAPGVLLELSLDNSASDSPATAFIGINSLNAGQLRPLDWTSKTLVGIAHSGRWLLAANPVKDQVFTLQCAPGTLQGSPLQDLADMRPVTPAGNIGGIMIRIPPHTTKTVTLAFAAYVQGQVTQGIDARYFYATYFPRVETVANFLLQNAQRLRESCTSFDTRTAAACPDPLKRALFAQGVRAYNATTQVVDSATPAGPAAYFATIQPRLGARNALLDAVDHLPWELFRNPWVIRNIFDLATSAYAMQDQLLFPDDPESPDQCRTGGMTFAADFGAASSYAPGALEGTPFASEILLNAIFLLTSYALTADDTPWAKTRLPFARELLVSLENRDHWDPAQRTGILKAKSHGKFGAEMTVLALAADAGPHLARAHGNLYLAVKTFCANLLLTTYFQNNNDLHSADFSYAFAQKTAAALLAAFNPQTQTLAANLMPGSAHAGLPHEESLLLAALEPLALPTYLGLTSTLPEYFPELYAALKAHALSCLKPAPAGCLDGTRLRLASNSPATDTPKSIAILFVLERLFQIDTGAALPGVWEHLEAAADPRCIVSALYVKPVA